MKSFALSFILLSFFQAFAGVGDMYASTSQWAYEKMYRACEKVNREDKNLKGCQAAKIIPEAQLGQLAEDLTFSALAEEHLKNLQCTVKMSQVAQQNLGFRQKVEADLSSKIEAMLPMYHDLVLERSKVVSLRTKVNLLRTAGPQFYQPALDDLQRQEAALNRSEINFAASIGSSWNGNTTAMSEFVLSLVKQASNDKPKALARLKVELQGVMQNAVHEIEESQKQLSSQSSISGNGTRSWDLNLKTKTKLVTPEMLANLSPALRCRLEAKYTKGQDLLDNSLLVGSFIFSGEAVLVSKIPNAFRVGAVLGTRSKSFISGSARMLNAASFMSNGTLLAKQIASECPLTSSPDLLASANNCQSTEDAQINSQIQDMEHGNCILAIALSGAPAVATQQAGKLIGKISLAPNVQAALDSRIAKLTSKIENTKQSAKNAIEDLSSPILRMSSALNSPLSSQFKQDLMQTAEYSRLKSKYGDGEGLTLSIPEYVGDFSHRSSASLLNRVGETTQSSFLKKTLQEIFPKAKFVAKAEDDSVVFTLIDSHEFSRSNMGTVTHIDMTEIKMANPGPARVDKTSTREKLGIPKDASVVSLNNAYSNSPKDIGQLVKEINKSNPNVIMISRADMKPTSIRDLKAYLEQHFPNQSVVFLSEMKNKISMDSHYIVINDVIGRMHVVYGVSDLNVTAGAVNLSEAALAKVPSLVFDQTSPYIHKYNPDVFAKLLEGAKETQTVQSISQLSELHNQVELKLKSKSKEIENYKAPYLTNNPETGKSRLSEMLNSIESSLDIQVLESKSFSNLNASARESIAIKAMQRSLKEWNRAFNSNYVFVRRGILLPHQAFESLPLNQQQSYLSKLFSEMEHRKETHRVQYSEARYRDRGVELKQALGDYRVIKDAIKESELKDYPEFKKMIQDQLIKIRELPEYKADPKGLEEIIRGL